MMKVLRVILLAAVVAVAISFSCGAQSNDLKKRMFMKGQNLWRGTSQWWVRGIEVPNLADPNMGQDEFDVTLIKLVEVGANSVCFDLPGLSEDGTAIDPKAVERTKYVIAESYERRYGALCRVFGSGAPADAEWRAKAVRTAAQAFKDTRGGMFLFTGPGSAKLAEEFSRIAPNLVTAAEDGGTINIVSQLPEAGVKKPVLLLGAIPPKDVLLKTHFLLPAGAESYSALDAAMAHPAESAPWTPDNSMLSEAERSEGFVSLFDGKTLDGWYILGENKNGFAVEDGCIVWKETGGQGLYSRERYDNFILRFDWKINKNGNSGLYLHAPRAGRQSRTGVEFQLQGDYGQPVTYQTTGSLYSVLAPKLNGSKPCGEWNSLEVMFDGPRFKATMNGQVVQDVNFDEHPELKKRLKRGFIALQDHNCFVAFRNIRVKKL